MTTKIFAGHSRLGLVFALALGFGCGVLLIAILGGAKGGVTATTTVARRVTVTHTTTRTTTAPAAAAPAGDPVVPEVTQESLSDAKDDANDSGFDLAVDGGGGTFGPVLDGNWVVVAQRPEPGAALAPGGTVHVDITRG